MFSLKTPFVVRLTRNKGGGGREGGKERKGVSGERRKRDRVGAREEGVVGGARER